MFDQIWTVFWRDWLVLKRRLGRYILSRMVSPVLYLVAFGWGVGRNINLANGTYLDFIVPGIIALNSMNITFIAVGTPVNMSRLYHKTLEEYILSPIKPIAYVGGKVLSGVLRGLISSSVIIALAYLFGAKLFLTASFAAALLLNCAVFSSLGFLAAMIMDSHEEMGNFSTYVLTPMSFLCATFFSPKQLPGFLEWIIEALPLTHASHILRQGSSLSALELAISFGVLGGYLLLFLGLSVRKMKQIKD
jgi:ABC-type multidrug transport system permease subunit